MKFAGRECALTPTLRLFCFVGFLFLLVFGKGCGLRLELLLILVTLTTVIKPNFLGRAIISLNFVRRFRNFIAETVPWKKNIASA